MEINNMDKFIIGENSSGKTRRMLEAAKENNAIVVCKNPPAMKRKADSYGIFGVEVLGYDGMNDVNVCGEKIAIDELGEFFKHFFGAELDSFTMTTD
jgi:hypothetical protein